MPTYLNRAHVYTSTTGTGTLTLGSAVPGYQTFVSAGIADGNVVSYTIEDTGNAWEVGVGTYSSTGGTLSRTLVQSSTGSLLNLSGQARVYVIMSAADMAALAVIGSAASFTTLSASGDLTIADKIVHSGDTNTAIRFSANDTVSVETGGSERLRVADAGITAYTSLTLNADPTASLQAATKQYVDTIASAGMHYHQPVRVESPVNLTATYNNGTSGVGATLTNAGTQTALVIDGVTLSLNDRVLIYQQSNQTQNGVYTVTNVGSGSTNWVLTRAADADSYAPSDPSALGEGDAFFVQEGLTGAGELYVCNTSGTITFGTTNITFTQVASTAVYTAGGGLTLTGTQFSHTDTSSQASVDNTGATFIQDVTLDTYGHVTALGSTTVTPSLIGAPAADGTGASGTWGISITGNAGNVSGTVAIANGGTGATTDATARTNLGLGTIATQNANSVTITGGTVSGITDLAIADGGTGASDAATARTNLGLAIGTNVQAYDAGLQSIAGLTTAADQMIYTTAADTYTTTSLTAAGRALLDDADAAAQRTTLGLAIGTNVQAYSANLVAIAGLAVTDSNFIVGNGTTWVAESGTTARTSLGLGTIATQSAASVSITGGSITGITDLAVADGGTGASDAATARTNLGLAIGTNVQAYSAALQSIAGATTNSNQMLYTTAANTFAVTSLTGAGRALLDDADAAAQRTTLGLVIGTNVQAYDAGLQSIAGLTTAADRMIYTTAADTYAVTTLTSFARGLLDDADAATARTTLGLAIGTNVQAYDADLAAVAGLSTNGMIARTGAGTAAVRTITGTANQITVTNGDGVSGDPTIAAVIATQAQAEAGTDATSLMTAQRTAQAISYVAGGTSSVKIANTALVPPTGTATFTILRLQLLEYSTGATAYPDVNNHDRFSFQQHLGFTALVAGSVVCTAEHRAVSGTAPSSGIRILKNGVQQTEWTTSSTSFVARSLTVSVAVGDYIVFQHRVAGGVSSPSSAWRNLIVYSGNNNFAVA